MAEVSKNKTSGRKILGTLYVQGSRKLVVQHLATTLAQNYAMYLNVFLGHGFEDEIIKRETDIFKKLSP